jgi:hypothetical protein
VPALVLSAGRTRGLRLHQRVCNSQLCFRADVFDVVIVEMAPTFKRRNLRKLIVAHRLEDQPTICTKATGYSILNDLCPALLPLQSPSGSGPLRDHTRSVCR